jgi:hypothetical protein
MTMIFMTTSRCRINVIPNVIEGGVKDLLYLPLKRRKTLLIQLRMKAGAHPEQSEGLDTTISSQ